MDAGYRGRVVAGGGGGTVVGRWEKQGIERPASSGQGRTAEIRGGGGSYYLMTYGNRQGSGRSARDQVVGC